jgi:hypothetical protein
MTRPITMSPTSGLYLIFIHQIPLSNKNITIEEIGQFNKKNYLDRSART